MRKTLVTALVSCADQPLRLRARRFLLGLSSDELEFIAEFLGACIIESNQPFPSRALLAEKITQFHESGGASGAALDDRDHKIILVREYLCRAGNEQPSARTRTAAG